MKATCPNDPEHKRFEVSAHVVQDWIVDSCGNFVEEMNACTAIIHSPDENDIWTCHDCGTEAIVED